MVVEGARHVLGDEAVGLAAHAHELLVEVLGVLLLVDVLNAGHPVPDGRSNLVGEALAEVVAELGPGKVGTRRAYC